MKTFARQTEGKAAREIFLQLAKQLEDAYQTLQGRLKYIEGQELQYRQH